MIPKTSFSPKYHSIPVLWEYITQTYDTNLGWGALIMGILPNFSINTFPLIMHVSLVLISRFMSTFCMILISHHMFIINLHALYQSKMQVASGYGLHSLHDLFAECSITNWQ